MKKTDKEKGSKTPKTPKAPKTRPAGIRRRMMLYLAAFVAFVIALIWLLQMVWLDDFYRWDKTRQLRQASDAVAANLNSSELDSLIDHLAGRSDVCILLLDERGRTLHSSDDIRYCLIHRMNKQDLAFWCEKAPEDGSVLTELFNVRPIEDMPNVRRLKGDVPELVTESQQSLLCARRVTLPGGAAGYLLLNAIITPLDGTVETLRLQLFIITIVIGAGALLLAWLIARKVTQPIIQTNEAARDLARGRYTPPAHHDAYREMAELNATLAHAAEELGKVEYLQHELIANISHDLRTPLTMIGGYAEAMRDIPGEATPENLQIVIDETARLNSLVSELLDFSRLQTGNAAMERAPFCLTDAVAAIVQRVGGMTGKDGYAIRFDPPEKVFITADEKRISQVVYNLLGNALTYTGEDKAVTLAQTVQGETVRLSVTDTGKGIPQEELPLIWHRYYRAKESHRRAVIGSGLGLSIVQSILDKHGMPYGVDSTVGEGTTFWFEADITPAPEATE